MKNNLKNIKGEWKQILQKEFIKPYFKEIEQKLKQDYNSGINILPNKEDILKAFEKTSFEDIKIVILGQDPYHGKGQAQGFCFSVPEGTKLPPSLKNIYKEIQTSPQPSPSQEREKKINGDLTSWTEQGVFLLNAILTVQEAKPASHAKIGWEIFTDEIIKTISDKKQGIIFLLWGAFAQSKKKLIDTKKHFILETSHPSPFSAHRGFLGSNCFNEANKILKKLNKKEINWKVK